MSKLDQTLSLNLKGHALQTAGRVLLLATSAGLFTSFLLIAIIMQIGL